MKISRETFKLDENMKSGYIMPIAGIGEIGHSFEVRNYKTPDYLTDKCFKILEDSGINLINVAGSHNKRELDELTAIADEHKIGICNIETNIRPFSLKETPEEYENYLSKFCEEEKPKYLSFINQMYSNIYENHIPRQTACRNFILNAMIVNKFSVEYGIPFWGNVQAGGNFGKKMYGSVSRYYPGDSEFLWMVNVLLAAGAKGIQYYPIVQEFESAVWPDGAIDTDINGILGADGLPGIYWSYARTASDHIRDVGPMLLQCRNEGMIASGNAARTLEGANGVVSEFRKLKSVESEDTGVIIGCLDFKHRTGLYVVNNDLVRRREVTLNFEDNQIVVITQPGNKRTLMNVDSVKLELQAGGAALLFLWKHLGD